MADGRPDAAACRTAFIAFLVVAVVMGVVLHRSVFGRYLFAVGKNEEAARYSRHPHRADRDRGLRHLLRADGPLGDLPRDVHALDLAGLRTAISTSSTRIAAAVLGGCSLRGGEGSILGIVLGTILLQVLQNLVNLLGIPSSLNFAVMGGVILIGVLADQQFTRLRERRSRR